MSEVRKCRCGAPCSACVQAYEVVHGGADMGAAVIAGSLLGAYAAWTKQPIFRHLCLEHAEQFREGLADVRRHVGEKHPHLVDATGSVTVEVLN